ncbi:hypothetical protein [Paenibacillus ihuae]|uniref:hypothetical protein n=1 Tax=Paenibacillus ihuae TaxID=1232431 RepID=UPI001FD8025E|nr:hypothetical protein [Paenibacillus ihuae]
MQIIVSAGNIAHDFQAGSAVKKCRIHGCYMIADPDTVESKNLGNQLFIPKDVGFKKRTELAPDANIRHRPSMRKEIEKNNIHVHLGYKGLYVTQEGVVCADPNGEEHLIPGTSVICALGQRARRNVVDELIDCAPYVAQIGDCVKASTITTAIYQGYHAALDI